MRMLSVPNYALYEVHANGEERRLNADEKPLLVQLNWHIDDREGRFLLKNIDQKTTVSNFKSFTPRFIQYIMYILILPYTAHRADRSKL